MEDHWTLVIHNFLFVLLGIPSVTKLEYQLPPTHQRGVKEMARLYIGNLPHECSEAELQTWLEGQAFKVDTVQVIRDLDTGASRGFAFAELPEVLRAQEAVEKLNGAKMEGHSLRVSEARPLPQKTDNRQTSGAKAPRRKAS